MEFSHRYFDFRCTQANCQRLVSLLEHERFDGFEAIIQIFTASLLFKYDILTNGTMEPIRGGEFLMAERLFASQDRFHFKKFP